jgi:regulator of sigma E protease
MLLSLLSIVVMLLGFGFVIFWHELGHFLGARWAGVRVEQFAVGMGHAIVSFRKGIGLRAGNTQREFDQAVEAEFKRRGGFGEPSLREQYDIANDLGISETEYRLSMLPIGGYVKPTGQDDLRPAHMAATDDPKSYAAAPVGKRMVIISAGVIMNVILAGILFFVLFRFVGFNTTRAVVGDVQSFSPAAMAGLKAGDELISIDNTPLHDFTKVLMNVALLPDNRMVDLKIRRDGQEKTLSIQARPTSQNKEMLALGFTGPRLLTAIAPERVPAELRDELTKLTDEEKLVLPGEAIVAVEGQAVAATDYDVLDRAIQSSFGRPVSLTVRAVDGVTRDVSFTPPFAATFSGRPFELFGLAPRTVVRSVEKKSSAADKLAPGDIILSIKSSADNKTLNNPTTERFTRIAQAAGANEDSLWITVQRGDAVIETGELKPATWLGNGLYGLGVSLVRDTDHLVLADVDATSAARAAGLEAGAEIVIVDGKAVQNWFELHDTFARHEVGKPVAVTLADGRTISFEPPHDEVAALALVRYANPLALLDEHKFDRETDSTLTALGWGVTETRDLILQGYLMLKRVIYDRTVPASQMSGPVGIFQAGTHFFQRGTDWFIWFLAVISANLAVVNFLPIPILDGWHFLSLVKEKITGRQLSERVQVVAQYIGLLLILSLVVFVTYNDILRLIG